FDLDDEIEQVIITTPIVDSNDEVRAIHSVLTAEPIRDLEPEVVVLHIRSHARMRLGYAAELAFPIAIQNDPINMATIRCRFPAVSARGVEIYVTRRARRIVGIEQSFDRMLANECSIDCGSYSIGSCVR